MSLNFSSKTNYAGVGNQIARLININANTAESLFLHDRCL